MKKREAIPFKVTQKSIEEFQFTQKQKSAYESLKKAQKRCVKEGLSLLAKQDSLIAVPSKFYANDMLDTINKGTLKNILSPKLSGVFISDSSADDDEYFKDKWIK